MEGASGYFIQEYLFISIGDYYNAAIDLELYCLITRLITVFLYNNNILFWLFFFSKKVFFLQILQSPGAVAITLSYTQQILSQQQCGKVLRCPQNQLREYLRFAVWLHALEF